MSEKGLDSCATAGRCLCQASEGFVETVANAIHIGVDGHAAVGLDEVVESVAIGVRDIGIGAERDLCGICETVAIGVADRGIGLGAELRRIRRREIPGIEGVIRIGNADCGRDGADRPYNVARWFVGSR